MTALLTILFVGIYIITMAIARAYVLATLWFWYIVPTFGLSPLKLVEAFGISLLVGFISHQRESKMERAYEEDLKEGDEYYGVRKLFETTLYVLSFYAATLLFGWIGTYWM